MIHQIKKLFRVTYVKIISAIILSVFSIFIAFSVYDSIEPYYESVILVKLPMINGQSVTSSDEIIDELKYEIQFKYFSNNNLLKIVDNAKPSKGGSVINISLVFKNKEELNRYQEEYFSIISGIINNIFDRQINLHSVIIKNKIGESKKLVIEKKDIFLTPIKELNRKPSPLIFKIFICLFVFSLFILYLLKDKFILLIRLINK